MSFCAIYVRRLNDLHFAFNYMSERHRWGEPLVVHVHCPLGTFAVGVVVLLAGANLSASFR
jgi:hypothetical protein